MRTVLVPRERFERWVANFAERHGGGPGIVTEAGLVRLRDFLSEVPAERITTPLKAADIPRLFTPETFCKLVIRAQREQAPAA